MDEPYLLDYKLVIDDNLEYDFQQKLNIKKTDLVIKQNPNMNPNPNMNKITLLFKQLQFNTKK
jgi:hypothetical protein